MWPKHVNFFGNFIRELGTLLIFNTIKNCPNGLTYYDLKQYGEIPHSKIYRMMKKLEDKGDLKKKMMLVLKLGDQSTYFFYQNKGRSDLRNFGKILANILNL